MFLHFINLKRKRKNGKNNLFTWFNNDVLISFFFMNFLEFLTNCSYEKYNKLQICRQNFFVERNSEFIFGFGELRKYIKSQSKKVHSYNDKSNFCHFLSCKMFTGSANKFRISQFFCFQVWWTCYILCLFQHPHWSSAKHESALWSNCSLE